MREEQHDRYKKVDTDMQEAIDAIVEAIQALKDSKKDISGGLKIGLVAVVTKHMFVYANICVCMH